MRRSFKSYLSWTAVAISLFCWAPTLLAQHRGNLGNGGARGGGGGGARPSPAARPNVSRPAPQSRPSMPQPKLPSGGGGNISRPNMPATRPSMPSARPNLPSAGAGNLSRPSPSPRPNPAGPNPAGPNPAGPGTRPGPTTRPAPNTRPGGTALPSLNNRPGATTLPGATNRPGQNTRPNPVTPNPVTPGTRPGALPGGGMVKPDVPTTKPAPRPGLGPNRPSPGPGLDNLPNRPTTRPTGPLRPTTRPDGSGRPGGGLGDLNRPNIDPPIARPPVTKPAPPNQRPSIRPGDRPNIPPPTDNRPLPNRPDRPGTRPLPGDRPPGISTKPAERPSLGGGNRPGLGDNNRPNRPDFGDNNRPNRPDFGGNNRPNRPDWGGNGGPNRPIIGGGNNNNIGNNININNNWNNWNNINVNRPGWNNNWNNNWGGNWNNNQWGNYWYNNHINHNHHHWYHGCWHGHWGGVYYRPVVWGASIWGLYGWGFQPTYVNPYYVAPAVTTTSVYNYSQPVVVYNSTTESSTDNSSAATVNNTNSAPAADDAAYSRFDEALQLFKAGSFRQSLVACDEAIAKNPNDPVMHEVRALIQFALGQYAPAAAVLNSLLASSPGMDWTTMSSLYDDVDTYTEQLRRLEEYCKSSPKDAAAQFVLAYHYMVAGYSEEAADVLEVVVELQPKDIVAQKMLESLTPPELKVDTAAETKSPSKSTTEGATSEPKVDANTPSTDLVGSWKTSEGKGTITLDVDEEFKFVWKAVNDDSPAIELAGNLLIQGEMMILTHDQQGNLTGKVVSGGPNKFTFIPSGSPADYPGLVFERVSPSN